MSKVEVATGGRPVQAVAEALTEIRQSALTRVSVAHDPGCPCLHDSRPLHACTCEVVRVDVSEQVG